MAESRALSQLEIDALLKRIPDAPEGDEEAPAAAAAAVGQGDRSFTRVIQTYDFRRPAKFSKEQWHTLQSMQDTFSRLVGAAFSSRLRTLVTVRLSSLDQGLYEEWQTQVPSQTVCYVLSMPPLSGNLVLEFSADVAAEVVDRLLGGNALLLDRSRNLGEIEMVLLRAFASGLCSSLAEMWSAVVPVKPQLQDIGTDAGLVQIARPNDVVISAFFEINLGDHLGAMSVCMPYTLLEPIAGKLSAQLWLGAGGERVPDARLRRTMAALLGDAPLDLNVELGTAELPVSSLLEMQTGDTLLLDARADRPLAMFVGDSFRFRCRPGLVGNQVAVRVTEVIEEPSYDFLGSDDDRVIAFPDPVAEAAADDITAETASAGQPASDGDPAGPEQEAAVA